MVCGFLHCKCLLLYEGRVVKRTRLRLDWFIRAGKRILELPSTKSVMTESTDDATFIKVFSGVFTPSRLLKLIITVHNAPASPPQVPSSSVILNHSIPGIVSTQTPVLVTVVSGSVKDANVPKSNHSISTANVAPVSQLTTTSVFWAAVFPNKPYMPKITTEQRQDLFRFFH